MKDYLLHVSSQDGLKYKKLRDIIISWLRLFLNHSETQIVKYILIINQGVPVCFIYADYNFLYM